MQIFTGAGWPTGIVAIPNRYMHSPVEVVSLADLEKCRQIDSRVSACRSRRNADFYFPDNRICPMTKVHVPVAEAVASIGRTARLWRFGGLTTLAGCVSFP